MGGDTSTWFNRLVKSALLLISKPVVPITPHDPESQEAHIQGGLHDPLSYRYIGINFLKYEFMCKCGCGKIEIDPALVFVLQTVRNHFNSPVVITSGGVYRCESYNRRVGGARLSKHLTGQAADFRVIGVNPGAVSAFLDDQYGWMVGIGRGSTFTHVDTGGTQPGAPRRWKY